MSSKRHKTNGSSAKCAAANKVASEVASSAAPANEMFEPESGNIFADLDRPDAEELQAKANLAHVIVNIVEDNRWSQRKAASVLEIAESEISDLMRGKLRGFSRERLERFLNVPGMEIRIQVSPRPAGSARAGLSVQVLECV
jgi:predicted XRE-type DNA-binding protein